MFGVMDESAGQDKALNSKTVKTSGMLFFSFMGLKRMSLTNICQRFKRAAGQLHSLVIPRV